MKRTMRIAQGGLFFLILVILSGVQSAYAQVDPVSKDHVAIGGYDVVSYFKPGKAMKGNSTINAAHNNVTYYFSSEENRQAFVKEPEKYLPQYEGYCALAIGAQKKRVNINPETFKVTQGRLYLFYNSTHSLSGNRFNSLEPWIKDEDRLIQKSDENWREMKPKGK
jgi:YHS domain-containing protein